MKKTIFVLIGIVLIASCSNPYTSPDTSRAISQEKLLEQTTQQTLLMQQEVNQLTRIANALERKSKDSLSWSDIKLITK